MTIRLGTIWSSLLVLTLFSGQAAGQCAAQYIGTCSLMRGDGNNDGLVNLSDIVFLLNMSIPPCNWDAADVNDDGSYNITDGIVLNTYLLIGGSPPPPAPASPFPNFGCDCTSDALPTPACCPSPTTSVHDAGPTAPAFSYNGPASPATPAFNWNDSTPSSCRSMNDTSTCDNTGSGSKWKASWTYGAGPTYTGSTLRSDCIQTITFNTKHQVRMCYLEDGPCVGPYPNCSSGTDRLIASTIFSDALVEITDGVQTIPITADMFNSNPGGLSILNYTGIPVVQAQTCYFFDSPTTVKRTEIGWGVGRCADFTINSSWSMDLTTVVASIPTGCTPWRISKVQIGLIYMHSVTAPETSFIELMRNLGTSATNVKWNKC